MSLDSSQLKQYLANLPRKQGYVFNEETRRCLRRLLYWNATSNGKYIHELFKDENYTSSSSWDDLNISLKNLSWIIHDHKMMDPSHPNSPCVRKFRVGEPIYRCLTCGLDETCALCSDCFNEEDHKGHQLYINICQRENGGVCDCGDPEAWTVPLDCKYFKSNVVESDLADDFYQSLFETFEVILDYIVDVMANSNLMYSKIPQTPQFIRAYSDNSALLSSKYGLEDINSKTYALVLYNDQVRQQQDAIRRIHLATGKLKNFATMITQEVETYGKAVVFGSDDLDLLIERQNILCSTGLNTAIRSMRDVFREESVDEAIKWIEDITRSSIFQKYKGFRDLVCKAFVKKWDSGVADQLFSSNQVGSLDKSNLIPVIQEGVAKVHPEYWDFEYKTWSLPDSLCEEIGYNDVKTIKLKNEGKSFRGSRLQYLLFMDIRFWKSIRLVLHDLYIYVLISNLTYKQIINCQYVDMYPQVSEMFLSTDREAESSLMCSLSTQLFTCPSNATNIIRHGSITRFLALFYSYITKNVVESPNSIDISLEINFSNLKNRKWCQLFFDMSYIISRNELVELVFCENVLNQIIDVLLLFQGCPTLKRSATEHVEYESSDYTIYFHAVSILSHFMEGISRCMNKLSDTTTNRNLVENAINLVIRRIGENINHAPYRADFNGPSRSLSDVELEPLKYKFFGDDHLRIIDFQVSKQNVSFIHSLHSFLSWLIELNKFFRNDRQLEHTFLNYFTVDSEAIDPQLSYSLQLFDYPLRTLVLLSQIKVGFWVRNGFSVRTQMQIYRKSTIRDGGYSRDLYLTQCFVASLPELFTTATLFERWELMPWINNDLSSSVYGKDTTSLMVEECLLFLINILTDDTHLKQLTGDKVNESRVMKEIICALCFKPLSFSELIKEVPDHIASEKRFECILDVVADLIPPKFYNDVGLYKLKEKYFDEIDPFFVHYTSNKRDEAIEVLKKRVHTKTGKPMDEICLEPNVISLNEDSGMYLNLLRFTTSPLFISFLSITLKYIAFKGLDKNDTLLDLSLYLVHISCIYNYEGRFISRIFQSRHLSEGKEYTLPEILYKILLQEEYKPYHIRIRVIFLLLIKQITPKEFTDHMQHCVENYDSQILSSTFVDTFMETEAESDRKKKLANKRKMKILQKLKKQQDKFLANNDTPNISEQSDAEMMEDDSLEDGDKGKSWKYPEEHCILCQMHKEGEPFGTVGCITNSPEFRHIPFNDPYWFIKSFSDNENLDNKNSDFGGDPRYSEKWRSFIHQKREELVIGPAFPHDDGLIEDHYIITSCSHGMHYSCFLQYYKDSRKRATQITRKLPEDFDKQEFLCPLCKSLNNCFIPVMSQSNRLQLSEYLAPDDESNLWYSKLSEVSKVDFQKLKDTYVTEAITSSKGDMIPVYYQTLFINPDRERKMHTNIMHSLASSLGLIGNLGDVFEKPNIESILLRTIESVEVSLRGVPHKSNKGGVVINQLSNQLLTTIRVFSNFRDTVELMNLYTSSKREKKGGDLESSKFISAVEQTLAKISVLGDPEDLKDIILTADFFEMFLEVEGAKHLDIKTNSILRTCFISQVLQNIYLLIYRVVTNFDLLLSCILELPEVSSEMNNSSIKEICRGMYNHIIQNYKISREDFRTALDDEIFLKKMFSMIVRSITPFLRKCAIFGFIKAANSQEIDFDQFSLDKLESDRLCQFLRIPTLNELLVLMLCKGTPENLIFVGLVKNAPSLLLPLGSYQIEYPGLISLLELPERLDDFFTKLYYPSELYHIKNPAVCLHCCEILDMQNLTLDSQKGECYQHYKQHCFNDDNGIFLLPKNTRLLLLHEDNGSFYDAPYVDRHYETDKEGTHGHVMYLSKERYSNFIRSVWLGHDIANFITRALENNVDVGGWETI